MTPEQYMDAVKRLDGYYHLKIDRQLHDMNVEIRVLAADVRENKRLIRKICRRLKIKINEKD